MGLFEFAVRGGVARRRGVVASGQGRASRRKADFTASRNALGSIRMMMSMRSARALSSSPAGAARCVRPIEKPTSASRNASVRADMATASTTAPVRLPAPPITSIAMMRKVRSR